MLYYVVQVIENLEVKEHSLWMSSYPGVTIIFADPDACYNQRCFVCMYIWCTLLANVTTIVELEGAELFH